MQLCVCLCVGTLLLSKNEQERKINTAQNKHFIFMFITDKNQGSEII